MRKFAAQVATGYFVEIYYDSGLDVCESRDVKGLYKKG
jgi:adenylylsulfate kinase-like enzyme